MGRYAVIHSSYLSISLDPWQQIPLPKGTSLVRRTGKTLCVADQECYNVLDIESASLLPILPISQSNDPTPFEIKPSITVISDHEFLILSWMGASTLGVIITTAGDPTRGTLEWDSLPESVCKYTTSREIKFDRHPSLGLDYPHLTALMPDNSIVIHDIETLEVQHTIPSSESYNWQRSSLIFSPGYFVPSSERVEKMRKVPVKLVRPPRI